MTAALGFTPVDIAVHLTRDADFTCVLHSESGSWPTASVITLVIGATTFTATHAAGSTDATFNVDKATVNTVINAGVTTARLWYVNGTEDVLWGMGSVVVHG